MPIDLPTSVPNRRHWLMAGLAGATGWGLAGCSLFAGPRVITLGEADLAERVNRLFPQTRRLREVLEIELSTPQLRRLPESNRLALSLWVRSRERLLGSAGHGQLAFDGALRWAPQDASLRLTQVRVQPQHVLAQVVVQLARELNPGRAPSDNDKGEQSGNLGRRHVRQCRRGDVAQDAIADGASVHQLLEEEGVLADARHGEGCRSRANGHDEQVVLHAQRLVPLRPNAPRARVVRLARDDDGARGRVVARRVRAHVRDVRQRRVQRLRERAEVDRADGRRRQEWREQHVVARRHADNVEALSQEVRH